MNTALRIAASLVSAWFLTACGGVVEEPGDTVGPLQAGDAGGAGGSTARGDGGATLVGPYAPAPGPDSGVAAPNTAPLCATQTPTSPGGPAPADCRCTRRPGAGNGWQCPMGADESVSVTVGAAGGVIELWGQQGKGSGVAMKLDIPPGALDGDTLITVTETSHAPPGHFVDWSPVWKLEPTSLTFAKPVKLWVPWSSNDGDVDPSLAVQWSADGCAWAPLGDSYINAGFHNASTTRLGYAFSGYQKTTATAACP